MGENERIIELSDVVAGYDGTEVVHGIDLHVDNGEIACLVGPNGSGKSTVLKSVYGFADVMRGAIRFRETDITHASPQENLRNGIGYILQSPSVFSNMSVHENMLMGGFIFGDDEQAADRAEELYAEFPVLEEKRSQKAKSLSGGERRLLEVARMLVVEPEMLLLDEPSIGLEPKFVDMVFDRIAALNDAGITILLVEQNVEKGLSLADTGFVLAGGEIKFAGRGDELLEDEEISDLYLGGQV